MSNYKKIGSIAIGIILLSIIIKSLLSAVSPIVLTIQKFGGAESWGILLTFAILILVLLWLFMVRNAIANKLFKDKGDIDMDKSITFPQAVNLACIFAGLIVLSTAIPAIFTVIYNFTTYARINSACQKIEYGQLGLNFRQLVSLVPFVLKLTIGFYLVFGAPHFVRWQIKRIKKLTEQTVE